MITAAVERLIDTLEELKPLFVPHFHELALDQDRAPLDPQYEVYLEREARGEVLLVTLRDRGAIVAYFVGFVCPGLHYRTTLTLTEDIFWLSPDYRAEDSLSQIEADMLAKQLFDAVLAESVRRGVKRCYFGSKWHTDASILFEYYGAKPADLYYSIWLGGG